jgi:hypothetical protein
MDSNLSGLKMVASGCSIRSGPNSDWKSMIRLLLTGGIGISTLRNYYKQKSGYIFAKTGSLSDVLALDGYMINKKIICFFLCAGQ